MLLSTNEFYEHCTMIIFFFSQDPLPSFVPMAITGLVAFFRSQSIV